jgi:hypothetical protein
MKGYVKNKTHLWRHAMKRSIGPGQQVPLDELYEQYGKKYDIQPGADFVQWLSSVKLRDPSGWEIVYDGSEEAAPTSKSISAPTEVIEQVEVEATEEPVKEVDLTELKKPKRSSRSKDLQKEMNSNANVRPFIKKELTIQDVIGFSVREARAELKKITDIKLLKYALTEARQLAGKDSLAILLRRRVQELELTRR